MVWLVLMLAGCPVGTLELGLNRTLTDGAADDDDAANDDDGANDDDAVDDDDATDLTPIGRVNWGMELGVGDVVAVEEGVRISPIAFVLQVHYWSAYDDSEHVCTQRVYTEGVIRQGEGAVPEGCSMCSGFLVLDPDRVEDISDPDEPNQCDPAAFDDWEFNIGLDMLTPIDRGGWGDALQMAYVDVDWQLAEGWSPSPYEGYDAPTIIQNLSQTNLAMTGTLLMLDRPGSLVNSSGLPGVADPIESGAPWLGFYFVLRPADDPLSSSMLEGGFGGQSYWNIDLGG